jgi:hypothetical protein
MDSAAPTIFERIEQKLNAMGARVDNTDISEALKQVEARLNDNPDDMDSKLTRLELKVVELARMLDAALAAGSAVPARAPAEAEQHATPKPGVKKIKKLQQNPATGVIEEVEVEDSPSEHFIVADSRGRFTVSGEPKKEKKTVFIAATDDEPVNAVKK